MNPRSTSRAGSPLFPATSSGDVAPEAVGEYAGVDGGDLAAAAAEDVQPKVVVPSPEAPTASQLAEHRDGGHMPYRSWCDECVEAFGREEPHFAHDGTHKRTIPVVSLDY